ncbi:hypothetical protein ACFFQW_22020 [Umezawaea endophytica]|uniref:HEAT repeat protein n=1 Tax=Umezawaea endophytica TaxID=1654476 RepID=A0A9X2VJB3_9PSEU|nr:hypothetical protein [Umezawaea endophytica]MCS7477424.1 hypothetical protein [Umezawaea endophytica]
MKTSDPRGDELLEHLLAAESPDVLASASASTWLAVDEAVRYCQWDQPTLADVLEARRATGRAGALDRVLAACDRRGWAREAAVVDIVERGESPQALALRAADRVPKVRDRARAACEPLLDSPSVVEVAPVAFALRDHPLGAWLAERVESALRSATPAVLAVAREAADVPARRFAYDVALERGILDLDAVLRGALRGEDRPIRVRCAEAATRLAADVDDVRVLLTCRAACVRAAAVRAIGQEEHAVAALTDRSARVRTVARSLVDDPAAHCRARLPEALLGLGETGVPADADLVRPWLAHPSSRVRADAVHALLRLGAVDVTRFEAMLTDPSGAVTRAVTRALRRHAEALDQDRLVDLLLSDARNVRTAAYRLLVASDAWHRLLADLVLVARDPERRVRAAADLRVWLSDARQTASPPPNAADLRRALGAAEPWLDPVLLEELAAVSG